MIRRVRSLDKICSREVEVVDTMAILETEAILTQKKFSIYFLVEVHFSKKDMAIGILSTISQEGAPKTAEIIATMTKIRCNCFSGSLLLSCL